MSAHMANHGPSASFVSGRFNVWLPNRNQYVSFDTLREAKADVQSHKMGVILNPKGQVDPGAQAWSGWTQYRSKFPVALNASHAGSTAAHASHAARANATGVHHASSANGPRLAPK